MKTPRKTFLVVGFLAVASLGGLGAWWQQRRDVALASLAAQVSQLETDARRAQAEHEGAQRDLMEAQAAAARIQTEITPQLLPAAQRAAWLARTRELKHLFAVRPDQAIPELRLLDDQTWLLIAKNARLDHEDGIRKALAAARTQAKGNFVGQLDGALRAYTKQSDGQLPGDISQLIPFMKTPPDPAMLQRYRMTRTGSAAGRPTDWAIEEGALIDPDQDAHFHVQANGGYGASSGPNAELSLSIQRAQQAYREANGRAVENPKDLIPFFNPPLDPVRQQRFTRWVEQMQTNKARAAAARQK